MSFHRVVQRLQEYLRQQTSDTVRVPRQDVEDLLRYFDQAELLHARLVDKLQDAKHPKDADGIPL